MAATASPRPRSARVAASLTFLALALGFIGGAHYYLARRLVLDPQLPQPWCGLALGALVALFLGIFLQPALERRLRPPWLRIVSWPFVVWMGVAWIGVNVLAAGDLLGWLLGAASDAEPGGAGVARFAAGASAVLIAGTSLLALRGGLRTPSVRRVEVSLARWPQALDGYRIAQLSDIHIGPVLGARFARALVARVAALKPDLIAVTGDLVDGSVEQLRLDVAPFRELSAPDGVFFVVGNHDFYSGGEAWASRAAELGMRPLRNERVRIAPAGRAGRGGSPDAGFDLAGVDDHHGDWVHGSSEDVPSALAGRDAQQPVVLLAHDPSTFKEAVRQGVDLQLSGHTHGGQIFPFAVLVRLFVPFIAGLYARGASQLYVSRGTGFWGPPMRLGAPAEITELVLRSVTASEGARPAAGAGR